MTESKDPRQAWTVHDPQNDNTKHFDSEADARDRVEKAAELDIDAEVYPPGTTPEDGDPVELEEAQEAEIVEAPDPEFNQASEIERRDTSDAFAGKMPDVDDQYVMELGGDTYIRRAGYARLARAEGFTLELTEVVGAHETDWKHAKYEAVVRKDGEHVANDVGSAHADAEDLANAEAHLDELAATRAATRAIAWGTGEGLNAVEEVAEEHAERAGEVR